MKKCKYCKTEIDAKAKICPNCKKKQGPKIGLIIFIIIIAIFIIGIATSGNDKKTKIEKFTIVEGTEKGYADSSNIFYYIEGTVKNNTDKTYSYLQVTYNVYDTEGNNLGTCLANNNNVEANGTWKFKAICSGETKNISSYKLAEITGW